MADSFTALALLAQAQALTQALRNCDALTLRYGLSLTDAQITSLVRSRMDTLAYTGRIELGESVLPKLIYTFCDSPYLQRDTYAETLAALQELFYTLKNEVEDAMSDDELIQAMLQIYHHKAQGSLEYLENVTLSDLWHAYTGTEDAEDEPNDEWLD